MSIFTSQKQKIVPSLDEHKSFFFFRLLWKLYDKPHVKQLAQCLVTIQCILLLFY